MTIKEFIETAEKGGFNISGCRDCYTADEQYLLNPEAWKAVGKVKGWDHLEMTMYDITQENDRWGYKATIKPQWMWYMNKMVQELCSGKTLEEYIATL